MRPVQLNGAYGQHGTDRWTDGRTENNRCVHRPIKNYRRIAMLNARLVTHADNVSSSE